MRKSIAPTRSTQLLTFINIVRRRCCQLAQIGMDLTHDRDAVAHCRGYPFRGFRAHVADRKHARHAGFERVWRACLRPSMLAACEPGHDKTPVVELYAARAEPIRLWVRADKEEQMTRLHHFVLRYRLHAGREGA